jgi:hypothetical protein
MVQNPQAMDANPLPTVICVLRSGGIYGAGDVEKLRNQVARHLSLPHEFVCLSDVEVSCKRISLQHDWSGWWSKVELFRPGVIQGPTVYMDLDNVILGDFSDIFDCGHDFAMMQNLNRPTYASSAVMYFSGPVHLDVYHKFVLNPNYWVEYHQANKDGPYLGDQAFIWSSLGKNVPLLGTKQFGIRSYRKDVLGRGAPPDGSKIVCFGGVYKPRNVKDEWLKAAWR